MLQIDLSLSMLHVDLNFFHATDEVNLSMLKADLRFIHALMDLSFIHTKGRFKLYPYYRQISRLEWFIIKHKITFIILQEKRYFLF